MTARAVTLALSAVLLSCGGRQPIEAEAWRDAREADAQYGTPWRGGAAAGGAAGGKPASPAANADPDADADSAADADGPDATAPPERKPRRRKETRDEAGATADRAPLRVFRGRASYYSDALAGNTTANGDTYDPARLTAASRTLPFGTVVRVVRVDNGKHVTVRINDRGPFGDRRRVIDLSRRAAEALDMIRAGVVDVRVEVLALPE